MRKLLVALLTVLAAAGVHQLLPSASASPICQTTTVTTQQTGTKTVATPCVPTPLPTACVVENLYFTPWVSVGDRTCVPDVPGVTTGQGVTGSR